MPLSLVFVHDAINGNADEDADFWDSFETRTDCEVTGSPQVADKSIETANVFGILFRSRCLGIRARR